MKQNPLYIDDDIFECCDCGNRFHEADLHTWSVTDWVCGTCNHNRNKSRAEWQCVVAQEELSTLHEGRA